MSDLEYPEHKHPHGINKAENSQRIWVCDECDCVFFDKEARINEHDGIWGHLCKSHNEEGLDTRCESHLESYIPDVKESER